MNKRERIIVGIMLIAAVGAIIDFLISRGSSSSENDEKSSPELSPAVVVTQAQTKLASLELNPTHQRVLQRVSSEWRDDLFLPGEITFFVDLPEEDDGPQTSLPAFTGYFNVNGKSLGIIDGYDYTEGDWLDDGSFQVLELSPHQAALQAAGGDDKVIIPMEKTP